MNSTKGQIQMRRKQQGLTLIELVVVLAILVALAGLIIGNFPSLFRKATRAVGANSIQDIARAVQFQATVRNNFGSRYDNLISGNNVYSNLASGVLTSTQLGTTVLSNEEASALVALGMNQVVTAIDTADNVTWTAFGPTASLSTVNNTLRVATVVNSVADPLFNNDTGTFVRYLIFGVGSQCTLVGADRSLLEAPTRSSAVSGNDAQSTYQRYGVVFGIRTNATTTQAVFAGAVGLESTGLTRTDAEIQDYNNN